jgi:beta-barrel assembly-enhancing protease
MTPPISRWPRALTAVCLSVAAACAFASQGDADSYRKPPDTSNLPRLGDASREDLSPILERKLGEEIMNDIRRDPDFLDDDAILEYLNNFGSALVAAAPDARGEANLNFYFFAVRDPMINAFALPGGFIAVHSALLIAAQNESELASVMSHEIGHVQQRHIARQLGKQREDMLLPLASLILAALAAKASPDAAMGIALGGQGLAIQRQLNFSRDAEREADRVGFQIMNSAGFDTSGMVAFFKRLQNATRLYPDPPPWLSSHPMTEERIVDIQARVREAPHHKPRPDSLDFHLVRARARVIQDSSVKGNDDNKKFFESQLTQENRQEQVAAQYGLAYLSLKRGDLAGAQSWLDKARASLKPRPGVFSAERDSAAGATLFTGLQLEIELAPGQPDAVVQRAVKDAAQASQQFPLSRAIAHQYAEAMIAAGKYDDAARYLRDQIQQYRSEPKLYDTLARTYAKEGKIALQHMALAESYALSGALPAAMDQLALARKANDVSFYDQAVIDAREREIKAKQKDEKDEKKDSKF